MQSWRRRTTDEVSESQREITLTDLYKSQKKLDDVVSHLQRRRPPSSPLMRR